MHVSSKWKLLGQSSLFESRRRRLVRADNIMSERDRAADGVEECKPVVVDLENDDDNDDDDDHPLLPHVLRRQRTRWYFSGRRYVLLRREWLFSMNI